MYEPSRSSLDEKEEREKMRLARCSKSAESNAKATPPWIDATMIFLGPTMQSARRKNLSPCVDRAFAYLSFRKVKFTFQLGGREPCRGVRNSNEDANSIRKTRKCFFFFPFFFFFSLPLRGDATSG
jgi:hypothetical protein